MSDDGQQKGKRILVVDDEFSVRQLLTDLLEGPGQIVTAFADPLAALEHIRQNGVDIAFLDLMMPGMTGVELAKHLKELHPQARVVICTGYLVENFASLSGSADVDQVVSKPFDLSTISDLAASDSKK